MADTRYLTQMVEPHITRWVSARLGLALQPGRLVVGSRMDGAPVSFAFDGVSPDRHTALLVSTTLTVKPGGTRKLHVDASILLQAPLDRRIMAFISEDVRLNFVNKCDGLLPLGKIEMLVCDDLTDEMRRGIATVQGESKAEVGDKGRIWKPGGPRR